MGGERASDHEVVAVGSRSVDRATEHARALGLDGARGHGSYEDLLADGCEFDAFARLVAGKQVAGMSRTEAVGQARALSRLHTAASA